MEMRVLFEVGFDILYLIVVITTGLVMLFTAKDDSFRRLFGLTAIILGGGDAFHLVPRVYAMLTDGLENHVAELGFGKFVTSITMTVFYLILYHLWDKRFGKGTKNLRITAYALALVRIALCALPQNQWTSPDAPLLWGILRNIPFAALGALMIWLFWRTRKEEKGFRFMWLAIKMSFLFYIPVVLFADSIPIIGMLMLPKTVCYVWMVYMGFAAPTRKIRR